MASHLLPVVGHWQMPLPEILSKIFHLLERDCVNSGNPFIWLKATYVCSQWRKIGLQTPVLWTGRIPMNPRLAALFLERSHGMPLNQVVIGSYPKRDLLIEEAWDDAVLPEIHRAKALSIDSLNSSERMARIISSISRVPMPYLKSLTCVARYSPEGVFPDMFPHPLPALQSLSLYRCALDLEQAKLSNLISLNLIHIPASGRLYMSQILTLLQNSPYISIIRFKQAILDRSDDTMQPIVPLSDPLQHLQSVSFILQSWNTCILLDSIALTSRSQIVIETLVDEQPNRIFDIVAGVQRLLRRSTCASAIKAMDVMAQLDGIEIILKEEKNSPSWIALVIRISTYEGIENILSHTLINLASATGNLTHFTFGISHFSWGYSTRNWADMFLQMPFLNTLAIPYPEVAGRILQLLTVPILGSARSYLLPRLEEVIVGDERMYTGRLPLEYRRQELPRILVQFVCSRAAAATNNNDGEAAHQHQLRRLSLLKLKSDADDSYFIRIRELLDEFHITE